MKQANICHRCGKERVLAKTWTEYVETSQGKSALTYTQYVCPDETCQKMVEQELEEKHQASVARQKAADDREKARVESRARAIKNSQSKKV